MSYYDNWVIQARKGLLEAMVLRTLLGGERYGYQLARELARESGLPCSRGTLYPLLRRLEAHGLVATRTVEAAPGRAPARKYYAITLEGRTTALRMGRFLAPLLPPADGTPGAPPQRAIAS